MNQYQGVDGVTLAFHEWRPAAPIAAPVAALPPVVLIHGFLSSADLNFVAPGLIQALTDAGRHCLAADLRGHGASGAPTDPRSYPADILAADQERLIAHLGLKHYDLIGYSLGARTALRMLARGAQPRRCVLGGMGAAGVLDARGRSAEFEDAIRNGPNSANPALAAAAARLIAQTGANRDAVLNILAQQVSTPHEALARITTPILVIAGERDEDNGSPEDLAALLPHARAMRTPGNHLNAVSRREFIAAIVAFLGEA